MVSFSVIFFIIASNDFSLSKTCISMNPGSHLIFWIFQFSFYLFFKNVSQLLRISRFDCLPFLLYYSIHMLGFLLSHFDYRFILLSFFCTYTELPGLFCSYVFGKRGSFVASALDTDCKETPKVHNQSKQYCNAIFKKIKINGKSHLKENMKL